MHAALAGPAPAAHVAPGRGRGVAAGLLAAAVALAAINLLALPGLLAALPPWFAIAVLICAVGPAVEEASKYGAFWLVVRPRRRGWRAYWVLGLTFGALEATLKLAPLLMPDASPAASGAATVGGTVTPLHVAEGALLARVAGAFASLALHTALGLVAAIVSADRPARPWMGPTLAAALHMAFNTFTTLAVAVLSRVAGEAGAQLAVSLAPLAALLLLLLTALGVVLRTARQATGVPPPIAGAGSAASAPPA